MLSTICVVLLSCGQGEAFATIKPQRHALKFASTRSSPLQGVTKTQPAVQPQTTTSLALTPVAAAISSIPSLPSVALACLIPSLLGFYKSEYGVSYAYGGAIAANAWMVLSTMSSLSSIAGVHALALLSYGVRLNIFLLYRELNVPTFTEFRERIEDRAKKRGSRVSRTPFILSVALLYGCMAAPIFLSAASTSMLAEPFFAMSGGLTTNIFRFLIGTTVAGFLLGAVGDLTKTVMKSKKGTDHLVTEGVFRLFRHPNYTGEFFGWTASAVAGLMVSGGSVPLKVACVVGALGINFVLVQAVTNLEKKQKEKYGDSDSYQKWIPNSWAGVTK
jgi:steroid 5-alpha reductase family enzyme